MGESLQLLLPFYTEIQLNVLTRNGNFKEYNC